MTRGTRLLAVVLGAACSLTSLSARLHGPLNGRQAQAAAAAAGTPGDDLPARLTARLPGLMEQAGVPGVQIAVIRDGTATWHGAFGFANVQTRDRVTDDTVFEAASLTKPVFAYAVLTLVDEGRLDLDTPLVTYLPGPYDVRDDDRLRQVTARHVLSHRSGFPNWRPNGQPLKILFTPGERFSYSGEGFVYLGACVERITGETIEAFVKRRVFEPLHMTSSSLVWQRRDESVKAYGHTELGTVAGRGAPWRANPAASLHTTASDYARFVEAAIAGAGLKPPTAHAMLAPQAQLDEAGFNTVEVPPTGRAVPDLAWGLGWGLERDEARWSVWHWGDNGPMKAFVAASPSRRDGIVVFLDSQNGLSIVPSLVREWRGEAGPAFAWLRVEGPDSTLGRFLRALREHGAATALEEYRAARTLHPGNPPLDEDAVNGIGYALLRDRRPAEAVLVFEQNVADHPASWNVYDSLGEALAAIGETKRAIEAYERSLTLNPASVGGAAALKKLKKLRGGS